MITKTTNFFTDTIKTFLFFAFHPLQWLFFRMPRLYEAVVCMLIFIKNNIPTKIELYHTWLHWSHWLLRYTYYLFIVTANLSINTCSYLQNKLKTNTNELDKLLKSS